MKQHFFCEFRVDALTLKEIPDSISQFPERAHDRSYAVRITDWIARTSLSNSFPSASSRLRPSRVSV